jgi:hypothetical protein
MSLNTGQKIVRRSGNIISIPDMVIARVNTFGSDQPKHLTFTDRHGRLIGDIEIPVVDSDDVDDVLFSGQDPVIDDAIEIPGADVEGSKNPAPRIIEIDDLGILEADPVPIEVETV